MRRAISWYIYREGRSALLTFMASGSSTLIHLRRYNTNMTNKAGYHKPNSTDSMPTAEFTTVSLTAKIAARPTSI